MAILLNAGNLWEFRYLDKVTELNEKYGSRVKVASMFGSVAEFTATARPIDRIPTRDWAFVEEYTKAAVGRGINIRWTLNASCIGSLQAFGMDWQSVLKDTLQKLHDIGVHEWTITSPLLIRLLHTMFPDDFIEVSTIYELARPTELSYMISLGALGVNISTSINRDPGAISALMRTGAGVGELSILANEACLYRCPWRRECYNLSSHNSLRMKDLFDFYPFAYCNKTRMQTPSEWVKSRMVLPSWLDYYHKEFGIRWFKVAYRTHPYEVGVPILEYYMSGRDPKNMLDLWPTIARLGGTREPKDTTFIPTSYFGQGWLEQALKHGKSCDRVLCGVDCTFCYDSFESSQL